jgi:hypothetical protein
MEHLSRSEKTLQKLKDKCSARNHSLITVEKTNSISTGTVTVFCNTCQKEFTTTFNAYNSAKIGCPT